MDAQEDNLANLRVASFSYYLKPGDHQESFVQKITCDQIEDPLPSTLSQETSSFPITPAGRSLSPFIKQHPHPKNLSQDNNNLLNHHHFSAVSFSPNYLNDAQEKFVFTVKAPVRDLNTELFLPRVSPPHVERTNLLHTGHEIAVFGADKYFNTRLDYATRMKPENKNIEAPAEFPMVKPYFKPAGLTPSVTSEASSWNSQAKLLRNLSQKATRTSPRKAISRRIFGPLGCSGPCFGKKAVHVPENRRGDVQLMLESDQEKVLSQPGSKRIDSNHFAFPVLDPDHDQAQNHVINVMKKQLVDDSKEQLLEDDPRISLEVFGSCRMKTGDIAANLARKLSMLTWDAIPKASSTLPTTTVGSSTTTVGDDMISDASSDLFEIEDISGTGYPSSLAMESSAHDNMSSAGFIMSPPMQYAPSEASIEWSVITASAADFSSVISDYDEKNVAISGHGMIRSDAAVDRSSWIKNPVSKETQKNRPGGLLGCKSHKAVNVAEVHKTRVERY